MPVIMQRSFSSGEIAPSLQSRADLATYHTGLNLCENFIVKAQGGAITRPGLRYADEVGDSTKVARLIPFSVGAEETYVLVFEDQKLRFVKDGAYVDSGGSPYEIVTPYLEADLFELEYAQTGSVMTITHESYAPRNLTRISLANFTLALLTYYSSSDYMTFVETPLSAYNATITGITQANPAVVTVSATHNFIADSIYISGLLGMTELNAGVYTAMYKSATTFELLGVDSREFSAYTSGGSVTINPKIENVGSVFGSATIVYKYVVCVVFESGAESYYDTVIEKSSLSLTSEGGIRINFRPLNLATGDFSRIYKETSPGSGEFGWIGDSRSAMFEDYNLAPISSITPANQSFSVLSADSYPSSVSFFQQRQVFGGSVDYPNRLVFTATGDYRSFIDASGSSTNDDDPINVTMSSDAINEIRHIVLLDELIVMTSGGEWSVGDGRDRVLTPSTVSLRQQSYIGSSTVKPVVVNKTIIFNQNKGNRLREFSYSSVNQDGVGGDISLVAEHLFKNRSVVSMAYSAEPYSVIWCVMDDGVMLGLTYQREHGVLAWHKQVTDGNFESVAVITENGRDSVYVTVKRTINSVAKRYIERLEAREETLPEDCFYVDSGLSYDGAPATVFSGLGHLEGEDVSILADGYVVTGKTVSSGSITLDSSASKVHVGLAYTPALETLDIDSGQLSGGLKSKLLSVSKVVIEVEDSRGGFIGPRQDPENSGSITYHEIKPRFISDSYDPVDLKTYKAEVTIEPQWSKGGGVRIEQRAPLPLSVLSIIPRIDVGGN